ncbi:MAG TPA: GNAT family N-acetyltransferase [Vicinamibacterales bacterium]|nr:GNAT family N-acetyltransferase [Vicinamibacterales bacterium]
MVIDIRKEALESAVPQALIGELNAELTERYSEPGVNYFRLDPEEVAPGRGAFLVAYAAEQPVGCGAVRLIDSSTAEIKRMYVRPAQRGQGIARQVLEALEAEARLLGVARIRLETGTRQPEAIALYSKAGFSPTAPFGEYEPSSLTVFMEKQCEPRSG